MNDIQVGDTVQWTHAGEVRTGTVISVSPVWGDWLTIRVDGSGRTNRVHKGRLTRIEGETA